MIFAICPCFRSSYTVDFLLQLVIRSMYSVHKSCANMTHLWKCKTITSLWTEIKHHSGDLGMQFIPCFICGLLLFQYVDSADYQLFAWQVSSDSAPPHGRKIISSGLKVFCSYSDIYTATPFEIAFTLVYGYHRPSRDLLLNMMRIFQRFNHQGVMIVRK